MYTLNYHQTGNQTFNETHESKDALIVSILNHVSESITQSDSSRYMFQVFSSHFKADLSGLELDENLHETDQLFEFFGDKEVVAFWIRNNADGDWFNASKNGENIDILSLFKSEQTEHVAKFTDIKALFYDLPANDEYVVLVQEGEETKSQKHINVHAESPDNAEEKALSMNDKYSAIAVYKRVA